MPDDVEPLLMAEAVTLTTKELKHEIGKRFGVTPASSRREWLVGVVTCSGTGDALAAIQAAHESPRKRKR